MYKDENISFYLNYLKPLMHKSSLQNSRRSVWKYLLGMKTHLFVLFCSVLCLSRTSWVLSRKCCSKLRTCSASVCHFDFFLSLPEDILPLLLEREEGRERTSMQERNIDWLPPVCTWTRDRRHPDRGLNPQPRCVPWLGVKPATFFGYGMVLQPTKPHWPCFNVPL